MSVVSRPRTAGYVRKELAALRCRQSGLKDELSLGDCFRYLFAYARAHNYVLLRSIPKSRSMVDEEIQRLSAVLKGLGINDEAAEAVDSENFEKPVKSEGGLKRSREEV